MLTNKFFVFGIFLLVLLASALAQLTPYIQGLIVSNAIIADNSYILIELLIIFGIILILDVFSKFFLQVICTNVGFNTAEKIRRNIFSYTISKSYDFFENHKNGEILQKTNNYVYNIGSFLSNDISSFSIGIARFLIIFCFMILLNYKLTLILLVLYLFTGILITVLSYSIYRVGNNFREFELHRNSLILQNIEGLETYLAYNDGFDYLKNYKDINRKYGIVRRKFYRIYNFFNPIIDFIVGLGTVVIYQITVGQSLGIFDVGVVVAMLTYSTRIVSPLQMISSGIAKIFNIKTVAQKVYSLEGYDIPTTSSKTSINSDKIDIKCENVYYENENSNVKLQNFNITIPFGQKLYLYGRYGIGKTVLANLLIGIYETQKGKILLNDINIKNIDKKELSNIISIGSDYVGIFNGTIYQNIRFAKPNANDKEIKSVIKKAGLTKFVNSFKNKEHTMVSEKTVSEGDQQLIAFARILLKNTPIVIFDEFTRDLDKRSEKRFLKTLQEFAVNKTIIFLSQEPNIPFQYDKKIRFNQLIDKN